MEVRINGKPETVADKSTVGSVLAARELDPALVSVEHNGNILERSQLDSAVLSEGDELEILFFMGGGQA
ncbi:MAG: sulfur carrier protein ThiS [Nitrospirae bacterium]|jgi:sulfur carrier protein|uniref:Thiamine biosynthesis protein ThiS n=1 Tax=Leptospirillum ferrodiazotrophum TaxID=412449 RepID=C6HUM3_9BACT|nr:MAG: thiamine biosynthesis protein ThiS [Leptospirillum ferrodiazotrophum]MCL5954479.1 sulfur carrier protein ThiS [Nitrospirota bacterium]